MRAELKTAERELRETKEEYQHSRCEAERASEAAAARAGQLADQLADAECQLAAVKLEANTAADQVPPPPPFPGGVSSALTRDGRGRLGRRGEGDGGGRDLAAAGCMQMDVWCAEGGGGTWRGS